MDRSYRMDKTKMEGVAVLPPSRVSRTGRSCYKCLGRMSGARNLSDSDDARVLREGSVHFR